MKSYSDDIPNVSTKEIRDAAQVASETNQLIKDNFIEIKEVENSINEQIKTTKLLTVILTILASLSLVGMAIMIFLLTQTITM